MCAIAHGWSGKGLKYHPLPYLYTRALVFMLYPEFAEDPRNIRFGLSTDGMNPFSEMSSSHSTWPVTILKNLGQLVFLYHDMMED